MGTIIIKPTHHSTVTISPHQGGGGGEVVVIDGVRFSVAYEGSVPIVGMSADENKLFVDSEGIININT